MTRIRTIRRLGALACLLLSLPCEAVEAAGPVEIKVYATQRRSIEGISELDRKVYFSMSDAGRGFDKRVRSEERMEYLLDDLGIHFGRSLGPVRGVKDWTKAIREDANRPGYADPEFLREVCRKKPEEPGETFRRLVGGRLDVAAHEAKGAFPDFMGEFHNERSKEASESGSHNHALPGDLDAAAELTAGVLQHGFSDFDRPAYYEPMNEPHWSFIGSDELADWHLKTHAAVRERGLNVKVGGPCNSVCYFYRNNYNAFNGVRDFIKKTDCQLDFYSFHAYDYLKWNGEAFEGRISSGLPLEGMLDLVESYAVSEFGKPVELVISEQGGYITGSEGRPTSEGVADLIAERHFPGGEGFENELRKRSIQSHILVSAVIANTLTFMDHPHVVKKSVPFLLLDSMGWDVRYYPTMYVPYEFEDKTRLVETRNTDFYKLFRDFNGQRVVVSNDDPDLQVRAVVDGTTLRVVINNLSDAPHTTNLRLPKTDELSIRRYGRNADYTPYLNDDQLATTEGLQIEGREAVLITARYGRPIPERGVVEETACYADKIVARPKDGKPVRMTIRTPSLDGLKYATLRIGVTRPTTAEPTVLLKFNGKRVRVPLEDAAPRLIDGGREYASTKLVRIDPELVRERNRVEVAFGDDDRGFIGSVVLRIGRQL